MKYPKNKEIPQMYTERSYVGESIEEKVKRIVENKEPITDGAPPIYTEKKDGVRPEYDIRTDKWDIALEAMDKVNKTKVAKSEEQYKKPEEEPKPDTLQETTA